VLPDRADFDSNLRANDYYSGSWLAATSDPEKAPENWLENCIDAGPELYSGIANFTDLDTSIKNIMDELAKVFREREEKYVILPQIYLFLKSYYWSPPGGLPLLQEAKYNIFGSNTVRTKPTNTLSRASCRYWPEIRTCIVATSNNATADAKLPCNLGTNDLRGIGCLDFSFLAGNPEDMTVVMTTLQSKTLWIDPVDPFITLCRALQTHAKIPTHMFQGVGLSA
jgi:hypothetical protein